MLYENQDLPKGESDKETYAIIVLDIANMFRSMNCKPHITHPRLKALFLRLLEHVCRGNAYATCEMMGITHKQYKHQRQYDPEFNAACEPIADKRGAIKKMKVSDILGPAIPKDEFIKEYLPKILEFVMTNTGGISGACKELNLNYLTVAKIIGNNPEISEVIHEAKLARNEHLLDKAYDQAQNGIEEELVHQGKPTGFTVKKEQPKTMMELLKGLHPEFSKDEHQGQNINVQITPMELEKKPQGKIPSAQEIKKALE